MSGENLMKAPSSVILKIASRCNLKCDYCYMFEHADKTYLHKPPIMKEKVFFATIDELVQSALKYDWKELKLLFHGGEPLLAGKKYFSEVLDYAKEKLIFLEKLSFSLQTNGVLIDPEWIELFLKYNIHFGISLDGPAKTNDRHRLDHKKRSTYEATVQGIKLAQAACMKDGLRFGSLLAVIDPKSSGREVFEHFVDELDVYWMDFLLPDSNYEDFGDYHQLPPLSYAKFLQEVFDAWWERDDPRIHVRILENIVDMLIGGKSGMDALGCGISHVLVVETDGSMEPLDVLKIVENSYTRQNMYIGKNSLEEFFSSPLLKSLYTEVENLPLACRDCRYLHSCHGGYLPHRYSKTNGFQNPSFYCHELKVIIEYIWQRISETLTVQKSTTMELL